MYVGFFTRINCSLKNAFKLQFFSFFFLKKKEKKKKSHKKFIYFMLHNFPIGSPQWGGKKEEKELLQIEEKKKTLKIN